MKPDPIVERLVPDPADVPDVRVLNGLLGKSTRKSHWRLYLGADLSSYVEFSRTDVVHSQQLEGSDHPLGGTIVWVKRDANLTRTQSTSREAQADFLQGQISSCRRRRRPTVGGLGVGAVPFSPSFHFWSICDELAAPSFMQGGDVFCGGSFQCSSSWAAECP